MSTIKTYNGTNYTNDFLKTSLPLALAISLLVLSSTPSYAAFTLNFDANPDGDQSAYFGGSCGDGGACAFNGESAGVALDADSPWLYESYVDPGTGSEYYHMVIGSLGPDSTPNLDAKGRPNDFYQDVYIRMGTAWSYTIAASSGGNSRIDDNGGSLSDSGGFTSGLVGRNGFGWSDGSPNDPAGNIKDVDMVLNPLTCEAYAGNGCDPLREDAVWSGNGTANPKRVIMRQINNDGTGSYTEFLKDVESNKPRVLQEIDDGDILAEFQVDMRGSDYDTNTVTIPLSSTIGSANTMVNKVSVVSAPEGSFDLAANDGAVGQTVLNTAGKYTWSPGLSARNNTASVINGDEYGWLDPNIFTTEPTYRDTYYLSEPNYVASDFIAVPIYDHGGYSYTEGSFDHLGQKWKSIMDPLQNACGGDPFCQ